MVLLVIVSAWAWCWGWLVVASLVFSACWGLHCLWLLSLVLLVYCLGLLRLVVRFGGFDYCCVG